MNPTLQKLKGKSQVKFVTEDSDNGKMEWVIRPIPFTLLLENFDKFSGLPEEGKELDESSMTKEQTAQLQSTIYPMMKTIVPKCIVVPRIVVGDAIVGEDQLHVDDIPFNSVVEIFNKIVEITGLDKLGDENRKKLPTVQSDKA
jgi:hypothetical protein